MIHTFLFISCIVVTSSSSLQTLHDFLEKVCVDGIAVIKNGPKGEKGAVEKIGERIGFIHRTHFG